MTRRERGARRRGPPLPKHEPWLWQLASKSVIVAARNMSNGCGGSSSHDPSFLETQACPVRCSYRFSKDACVAPGKTVTSRNVHVRKRPAHDAPASTAINVPIWFVMHSCRVAEGRNLINFYRSEQSFQRRTAGVECHKKRLGLKRAHLLAVLIILLSRGEPRPDMRGGRAGSCLRGATLHPPPPSFTPCLLQ